LLLVSVGAPLCALARTRASGGEFSHDSLKSARAGPYTGRGVF